MGKKNVNMKIIARECGVSINTVSHALRDFDDISKETKQRIRQKAVELGYMPNVVSQQIKGEEKPVVALLVAKLSNLYFSVLCDELINIAEKNNEICVLMLPLRNNYIDVLKQCVLQRVDMVVTHEMFPAEATEFAKLNNIKIIMIGNDKVHINADSVSIDESMSCEQVARYLWGIHKGKKFLFVGGDYYLSDLRYRYFKQTLNSLGATDVIRFSRSMYEENADRELLKLINDGYRSIFFFDDVEAYEALAALNNIVVDVRKAFPDLHLVGFDGLCENIVGMKQISTVLINYPVFAQEIYNVIKFRLNNPDAAFKKVLLPTSLHQRTNG